MENNEIKRQYIGFDTFSSDSNYNLTEEEEKALDEKINKQIINKQKKDTL